MGYRVASLSYESSYMKTVTFVAAPERHIEHQTTTQGGGH